MAVMFQIGRLCRILFVFLRYGLGELLIASSARPRYLLYALFCWGRCRRPLALRIRLALEDLGPIFVKFGQALSTRRDLLADDIADELEKLQDEVPSFSGEQARAIVEESLHTSVDEVFSSFDSTVLASASVAQVHAAHLRKENADVVVKVLRPGIERVITRDIGLLYLIAYAINRWSRASRRFRLLQVVAEYEKTIKNELDLMREAANASQLRRNFAGSDLLYVPEVYWSYCSERVMVMERIYGAAVNDVERLKAAQVDLQVLSERGVEIFFTQVFEHNFFHADMHPGNIFVSLDNSHQPKYLGVDFGIVGTLSEEDQYYLAENFLAFFRNDYKRVAELHIQSGWVPADTRADELESAVRTVCEPIFQRPLNEISFGQLLLRLFGIARDFDMEVQPQLILLQKTLLNVEGLGRQLYPDLDLWKTAMPFLEQSVRRRSGPQAMLSELRRNLPRALHQFSQLPSRIDSYLMQSKAEQKYKEQLYESLRDTVRWLKYGIIGALILAAAALFAALSAMPNNY